MLKKQKARKLIYKKILAHFGHLTFLFFFQI